MTYIRQLAISIQKSRRIDGTDTCTISHSSIKMYKIAVEYTNEKFFIKFSIVKMHVYSVQHRQYDSRMSSSPEVKCNLDSIEKHAWILHIWRFANEGIPRFCMTWILWNANYFNRKLTHTLTLHTVHTQAH